MWKRFSRIPAWWNLISSTGLPGGSPPPSRNWIRSAIWVQGDRNLLSLASQATRSSVLLIPWYCSASELSAPLGSEGSVGISEPCVWVSSIEIISSSRDLPGDELDPPGNHGSCVFEFVGRDPGRQVLGVGLDVPGVTAVLFIGVVFGLAGCSDVLLDLHFDQVTQGLGHHFVMVRVGRQGRDVVVPCFGRLVEAPKLLARDDGQVLGHHGEPD